MVIVQIHTPPITITIIITIICPYDLKHQTSNIKLFFKRTHSPFEENSPLRRQRVHRHPGKCGRNA